MVLVLALSACSDSNSSNNNNNPAPDAGPDQDEGCNSVEYPCTPIGQRTQNQCAFKGIAPNALPEFEQTPAIDIPENAQVMRYDSEASEFVWVVGNQVLRGQDGASAEVAWEANPGNQVFDIALKSGELFVAHSVFGNNTRIVRAATAGDETILELPWVDGESVSAALTFDWTGALIVATADANQDPDRSRAQDKQELYGKILRLNVDGTGAGYTIPADNPFAGATTSLEEIYALGFRAPQDCSIDAEKKRLWCLDHGDIWNEVNLVRRSENYGWPFMDGSDCRGDVLCSPERYKGASDRVRVGEEPCGARGGVAYGGTEFDDFQGAYLWVDACHGHLRGVTIATNGILERDIVGRVEPNGFVVTDAANELMVAFPSGAAARLTVPADELEAVFPTSLMDSGCFESLNPLVPGPDLIPYVIAAPLWTDDAVKTRYLTLPPGEEITFDEEGLPVMPMGTLILKMFEFQFDAADPASRRGVEVRIMKRRRDSWAFYSYEYNADGDDAELLAGMKTVELEVIPADSATPETLEYFFPDRGSCRACHGENTRVIGPSIDQLDMQTDYGQGLTPQVAALREAGIFGDTMPTLRPIVSPSDPSASLEDRARAYLHGNCAHCHRPGGWVPPDLNLDLRWQTPTSETETCGAEMQYENAWVPGDTRVVAGDPESSVLLQRMLDRGFGQMPLFGSSVVDPQAAEVVGAWIESLESCP